MYSLNDFSIIEVIIVALAAYRLAIMIIEEDGFLSIAFAIRLLGHKVEGVSKYRAWRLSLEFDSSTLEPVPVGHLGRLLSCFYCTSIWTGLFVPLFYCHFKNTALVLIVFALALSAIGILLENFRD